MTWEQAVDPAQLYRQWGYATEVFDPAEDYEIRLDLPGAVEARISIISARQPVWAAMCLTTGYASETDGDTGWLMAELALAPTEPWPSSELTSFCAQHENLGWSSRVLVNSARITVATIALPVLSMAGVDIGRLQLCIALHDGDRGAVRDCLRNAEAKLAQAVG